MKKFILGLVIVVAVTAFFSSCMRGISPYEAANGKAKCGKNYIR